ncbi:hypothetical protein LCGC14_2522600 [marine sediment metagenome]|uniref:Uncharacterized protein n=1 Tax=marine sediment metagenome TaxID=412755 RepID=A0A0F9BIY2_9ZZZZ
MNGKPLWMPTGSVRSLLALGVLLAFAAGSGFLVVQDSSSDLVKIVVGGWIAMLSGVTQAYFGMRQRGDPPSP